MISSWFDAIWLSLDKLMVSLQSDSILTEHSNFKLWDNFNDEEGSTNASVWKFEISKLWNEESHEFSTPWTSDDIEEISLPLSMINKVELSVVILDVGRHTEFAVVVGWQRLLDFEPVVTGMTREPIEWFNKFKSIEWFRTVPIEWLPNKRRIKWSM